MKHTVYRSGDMILDLVTKVSYKSFTLPQSFTIVALTATATAEVQQDIMSKLSIDKMMLSKQVLKDAFNLQSQSDLSAPKICCGLCCKS